ncbi:MAG: hypothetical protein WBQ20_13610 [Methyloceanibacter sp.]
MTRMDWAARFTTKANDVATDVANTTSYGLHELAEFKIVTDDVVSSEAADPPSPAVIRS